MSQRKTSVPHLVWKRLIKRQLHECQGDANKAGMTIASKIRIRRVEPDDVDALRALSIATFIDTYAEHNRPENMAGYIEKSFDKDRLRSELNSKGTQYFFAERGPETLGYLRLNTGAAQTNLSLGDACEIERIYVDTKYQGLKVGKLLFETALAATQDAGLKWLWLGVWDRNTKAIGFYEKMGFEIFGQHDFNLGSEAQSDLLMRLPIASIENG